MPLEPNLASSRILVDDDPSAIYEHLLEQGLTDGLPVIPPTEERVRAMLGGTSIAPDAVIATLPPAQAPLTVEKLAINAVMAGCLPEYLPVLIAAIQAMSAPEFNLEALQVTTHPATPLLLLNGPVRHALGVNSGSNALGQGWRANATIGRALRLVLVNVGGATPGTIDKATQGQPGKFTFCSGENEEESPWGPLHTERGLGRDQSAVTVVAASTPHHLNNGGVSGGDLLKTLTYGIVAAACNNVTHPDAEPLLLLCPSHAALLAGIGYDKDRLKKHLFEHARVPREWVSDYLMGRRRKAGLNDDGVKAIPMTGRWENFMVAVVGGPGGLHSLFVPTMGPSRAQTRVV